MEDYNFNIEGLENTINKPLEPVYHGGSELNVMSW